MVDLIHLGRVVQDDKIVGGPAWAGLDKFDILANAPAKATSADLRAMLQNLLADRFSLKVHKDIKPQPAFALVVAPGKKLHLKESDGNGAPGCKPQSSGSGEGRGQLNFMNENGVLTTIGLSAGNLITYNCRNVTMAAFAAAIPDFFGADTGPNPVADETDLKKGAWDFDLQFSFNMIIGPAGAQGNAERISFPDALEKQLGLKLDAQRTAVDVSAVDHLEKPSAN